MRGSRPGPAALAHPAASEPRHGDAAVPPRGRPPLPVRRRGASGLAPPPCPATFLRRGPAEALSGDPAGKMCWKKGETPQKKERCERNWPRGGKEEVRGRGCPAEGGCGEEQGLRKPRAGPCSPGVRPAGLLGTLCSPPESQPVLELFTGKFGPALRRREFVDVSKGHPRVAARVLFSPYLVFFQQFFCLSNFLNGSAST